MVLKKPSTNTRKPSSELLSAFSRSLDELSSSPRFKVIKLLRIGELCPKESRLSSIFRNETVSDLVETGVQALLKREDLLSEDFRGLIDLLKGLSAPFESGQEGGLAEDKALPERAAEPTSEKADAGILAIERSTLETELAQKKQNLKRVSSDLLSSKILLDYWEKDWCRAPFEECLSFKQFSDLDFEVLVKKKTFDAAKMKAVIMAIDKFMAEHDVRLKRNPSIPSNLSERNLMSAISPVVTFAPSERPLPLITGNLVRYFEYQCSLYPAVQGVWRVFYAHLPLTLDAPEIASLALSVNNAPSLSRRLLGMTKEEFDVLLKEAQGKLLQLFEHSCPKVFSSWKACLGTVGITEEDLFGPYFDPTFDEEFQRMILRSLLLSLGAVHPSIGSEHFNDIWTSNPEISEVIVSSLTQSNEDQAALATKIVRLLPSFPVDRVLKAISP